MGMTWAGFDPEFDAEDAVDAAFEQPPLPELSAHPKLYPGCCLALSKPLLAHLRDLLPPSTLTLSIGSGSGLLEALLLHEPVPPRIVGVEVGPSPNRYLPPSHHLSLTGTRFLAPPAQEAATWMFIYPKRIGLVDEYIQTYGRGGVEQIIWAGPKADWVDYRPCFDAERHGIKWDVHVESADEVGGRAWELIVFVCRRDE